MILQERGKLNNANTNILLTTPTVSFAKLGKNEFWYNSLEITEPFSLPQRLTCYVLINPWPRRQHQGKLADKDCFALQTKSKKAFGSRRQLPDLTMRRHKLSAMLPKRPAITLVNSWVMLRINEWRDISGFDYQKNTKWDWKVLLPLLPAVKGQSLLTHHIRKLLFAFITSSFIWNSFFNKSSSDNVWNFREWQQKSSLWSVLSFYVKTGHRI